MNCRFERVIKIIISRYGIFARKGNNLELFQWYLHLKSDMGPIQIDLFEWFFVPYDRFTTNKVIIEIRIEKRPFWFLKLIYPQVCLRNVYEY